MEQNLKQRLVGALVLISLAVIFVPLMFDGQQQRIDTSTYDIPEKPAITITAPNVVPLEQEARQQYEEVIQVTEAKKAQDEATAPIDQAVQAAVDKVAAAPAQATPSTSPADPVEQTREYLAQEKAVDDSLQDQPVTAALPLAEAWVIQVGAFSSEPNAQGLRDKLKAAGYTAFVKGIKGANGPLYKVYVGPEIRRAQMEQQKTELERKYNLKALILKYIP